MKKSLSKNSESSTQVDSPHSPLRFHSPMRWDGGAGNNNNNNNNNNYNYNSNSNNNNPPDSPEYWSSQNSPAKYVDNSKAIVAVDKFTQCTPDKFARRPNPPENPAPVGEPPRPSGKMRPPPGEMVDWKREEVIRKAALGFRLSEVVVCLISFSVMAADRTQGWSGDSFDRYREYRYCLSVNIIAFAYAGLQACGLACQLIREKHIFNHHLRGHIDFFMDQVLAYLLLSAASCAATRVYDWQSNWGKDEFTEMASASIGMAFLAFVAFAISSLISGYILCTRTSM